MIVGTKTIKQKRKLTREWEIWNMKKQKDVVGLRHRRKHKSRKQHPTTPPTTPPLCSYILSDGSKCRAKTKGREKRKKEGRKGSFENPINFLHLLWQSIQTCLHWMLVRCFFHIPHHYYASIVKWIHPDPSSSISPMVHFCLIALFFLFISFWIQNKKSLVLSYSLKVYILQLWNVFFNSVMLTKTTCLTPKRKMENDCMSIYIY